MAGLDAFRCHKTVTKVLKNNGMELEGHSEVGLDDRSQQ